jgi:hypothetical protein
MYLITWWTCDFPVWERVKHIVHVYNVHPSYKIKSGQNPAHYVTLNTVVLKFKHEQCVSLFPRPGNHMSTMFFCLLLSTCKVKYFLNCLNTIPQNN